MAEVLDFNGDRVEDVVTRWGLGEPGIGATGVLLLFMAEGL